MSEYEKALFRVYDRTLDGFWTDGESRAPGYNTNGRGSIRCTCPKLCRIIEAVLAASALMIFLCGCYLHIVFVGKPGCLEQALVASATGTKLLVPPNTAGNDGSDGLNGGEKQQTEDVILKYTDLPSGARLQNDVILNIFLDEKGPIEASSTLKPDYLFSVQPYILELEESTRMNHNFSSLNVALGDKKCFGSAFTRFILSAVVGYDVATANMLQYTLFSTGFMINAEDSDSFSWYWTKKSLPPRDGYTITEKLLLKVAAMLRGCFAFFLLSTVTSIIVRVFLSSGVAAIFAMYVIFEKFRLAPDPGALVLAYPWLGEPFHYLRQQSKPTTPFVLGHILSVVILYCMYNGCQLAWSYTLYQKMYPSNMPIFLYGLMLFLEYFSLIYVRSNAGCILFPRFVALVLVSWHLYYYYVPMGYFALFLVVIFLMLILAMAFAIEKMELPALMRGEVSIEHPRMRYVELPWQFPRSGPQPQPPIWTLFIPPNASPESVYTGIVPGRPENVVNETAVVDSERDRLNEGRDGEVELHYGPQQEHEQGQQTRRYQILNQTPDDIELGGGSTTTTIH